MKKIVFLAFAAMLMLMTTTAAVEEEVVVWIHPIEHPDEFVAVGDVNIIKYPPDEWLVGGRIKHMTVNLRENATIAYSPSIYLEDILLNGKITKINAEFRKISFLNTSQGVLIVLENRDVKKEINLGQLNDPIKVEQVPGFGIFLSVLAFFGIARVVRKRGGEK